MSMYKMYGPEEYINSVDESAEKIRQLLSEQIKKISVSQYIIDNDYPFDDLFLRKAKAENEMKLLEELIIHLDNLTGGMKNKIADDAGIVNYWRNQG